MRRFLILSLAHAAVALMCTAAFAQVPEPPPAVAGSGGGNSNDGTIYLSDTIGQSIVGVSTQAPHMHRAGFWYMTDQLNIGPSSAVAIASFDATAVERGVELLWIIASSDGLEGFNVYRSGDLDASFVRLNDDGLLPAGETSYLDGTVEPGRTYEYRIGAVDRDGEFLSMVQSVTTPHRDVELYQNRPNPFNPSTRIDFYLPSRAQVTLSVYDVRGKLVRTLVDQPSQFGHHSIVWNGTDNGGGSVSSGIYFYRLQTDNKVITKKLVVVK
jgi:hypothetical protein